MATQSKPAQPSRLSGVATATDLARSLREVRELAGEGPVLITRRGRPVAIISTDRQVVAEWSPVGMTVSAREMSRGGAVSECLDAVEGGEYRVLTETNRPVAVVHPVDAFRSSLLRAAGEGFAGVVVPADDELAEVPNVVGEAQDPGAGHRRRARQQRNKRRLQAKAAAQRATDAIRHRGHGRA